MYRDFSDASKQRLLELVDQVESEKWCDFTDWIGDRWLDFQSWIGRLNIKNYLDNVNEYHKLVIDKNNSTKEQIEKIFADVAGTDNSQSGEIAQTKGLCSRFDLFIRQLSEIVSPANGIGRFGIVNYDYSKLARLLTEIKIVYQINVSGFTVYDLDKPGRYGGDQGVPMSADDVRVEEYRRIFERNNPTVDLSSDQFKAYLKKLNNEGCGYVAMVNTVFQHYAHDSKGFEEIFGYPMYDENGNLNFDLLLLDIYSRMDNRDSSGKYDEFNDYDPAKDGPRENYIPLDDDTGRGSSQYDREYYLEEFMKERGVNVDVKTDANVTTDNLLDILSSGRMVIIAFRNGNLYYMDGTIAQPIIGGHAMTVVGLTEDGRMIVSSWGRQYYIDPDEVVDFDNNGVKTSMTFSIVEYE